MVKGRGVSHGHVVHTHVVIVIQRWRYWEEEELCAQALLSSLNVSPFSTSNSIIRSQFVVCSSPQRRTSFSFFQISLTFVLLSLYSPDESIGFLFKFLFCFLCVRFWWSPSLSQFFLLIKRAGIFARVPAFKLWSAGAFFLPPQGVYYPVLVFILI